MEFWSSRVNLSVLNLAKLGKKDIQFKIKIIIEKKRIKNHEANIYP